MDSEKRVGDRENQYTVDWKKNGIPDFNQVTAPSVEVSSDIIEQFQYDGAVLMPGLFKDWVQQLRRGLQRTMDSPAEYAFPCENLPEGEPGRFFDCYCNWLLVPEYFAHITESCAASLAGQLMNSSEAQFFHEHAFSKEAGTQSPTPWHQDMPYYCVDGSQTVSLYVALDETPADVAVQFVKGSHRWQKLFHPVTFLDGDEYHSEGGQMEATPDVNSEPDNYDILAWNLEAGDCIAFDFKTLHGTTAGEVKSRRRAVSTRWLGDDVTYCRRDVMMSPPYPDLDQQTGERLRTDWFPILWRRSQ